MKTNDMTAVPAINTPAPGDTSIPEPVRLGNGVPVYMTGNGTLDLLRIEFVFAAGQVMEDVHMAASSTSAMLTEGSRDHDAATINDLIDSTGAALTHSADKDTAGLVTVTLTRKLDDVIALASEVLFSPIFPENEFRMLTDRRIQAFLTSRQRTSVIARETFYEALCGSMHPYGRVTTEDDYRRLTTGDLRKFHQKHYRPENMYVTVAGKEPWKALPVLEKYFSDGGTAKWQKPVIDPAGFDQAAYGRIFREVPGSVQSTVRMGWRGITRDHPDYLELQVATMILGGYFGSRLMRSIREEKGFTYGIQAVAGAFHGIGYITIMTDVANVYREETVTEIRNEIEKLRTEEVTEDEMALVRNHMMGELARMFDGPFAIADAARAIIDYEAGTDFYTRLATAVKTVSPARIKEIFNKYFNPDEAWEIIAGSK